MIEKELERFIPYIRLAALILVITGKSWKNIRGVKVFGNAKKKAETITFYQSVVDLAPIRFIRSKIISFDLLDIYCWYLTHIY